MKRSTTTRGAKSAPQFDSQRAKLFLQSRFNPIRNLTPELLAAYLDRFDVGELKAAAMTWEKIEQRDDRIKSVTQKRKLAVSLLNWEVLTEDDTPEAEAHKEALEAFYNNLTATDAIDENRRGGFSLLVRQMMDAIGKRYAVHEIVWDPSGEDLTATFRFVPLWFFENKTGRIRFLPSDTAIDGTPLEPGGWMVTATDGLMEATSVAYMFKQLSLKDWLIYTEKFGMPGLHGKTDAPKGSDEWDAFRDALASFGVDWAMLTSLSAEVDLIETKGTGTLPHPELVDRMDRAISTLWRGGDLSTMAKGERAIGANAQDDEGATLEEGDALMISETLNEYVDKWVIAYRFGSDRPKAYLKITPKLRIDYKRETAIDEFLLRANIKRGVADILEKYQRPQVDADEDFVDSISMGGVAAGEEAETVTEAAQNGHLGKRSEVGGRKSEDGGRRAEDGGRRTDDGEAGMANALSLEAIGSAVRERRFDANARELLGQALAADLDPIRAELEHILALESETAFEIALETFLRELPQIAPELVKGSRASAAFADILATALVSGAAEGRPITRSELNTHAKGSDAQTA